MARVGKNLGLGVPFLLILAKKNGQFWQNYVNILDHPIVS
jgi:hypothetical protein